MHFAGSPRARRDFLLEGITSVCDLGSTLGDLSKFEQRQTDGQPVARGFAAGQMFTVPGGKHAYAGESAYAFEVPTPEEARAAASAKASPPQFWRPGSHTANAGVLSELGGFGQSPSSILGRKPVSVVLGLDLVRTEGFAKLCLVVSGERGLQYRGVELCHLVQEFHHVGLVDE